MECKHPFAHPGGPGFRRCRALALVLTLGLTGCGGVEPVAIATPSNDPEAYAGLVMNLHIATLSTVEPYDTVQLTAMPVDLRGNPLSNLPASVLFFTPDTADVFVTADGVVQARRPTTGARVIARLELPGNQVHADTTLIDITSLASPPRMASISTFPVGDSTVVGDQIITYPGSDIASEFRQDMDNNGFSSDIFLLNHEVLGRSYGYFSIYPQSQIRVLDSLGNSMANLRVEMRALDPKVGLSGISQGAGEVAAIRTVGDMITLVPIKAGSARVEARTTAYGITMADTVTWKVTPPPYAVINYIPRFDGTVEFMPSKVRIRTHGAVSWWNWMPDTTEVVFDDPTNVAMPLASICQIFTNLTDIFYSNGAHCGIGNVVMPGRVGTFPDASYTPVWQALWYGQLRQFPVAGTYRFRDARTGKTGEIVVSDEPE